MNKIAFAELVLTAFRREAIKKLVFSKPLQGEISKVSARICKIKGGKVLAAEYSLPGNTVSHKNIADDELCKEIESLIESYGQANLITLMGDAEYKLNKKGRDVLLGGDALKRRLAGEAPAFESAIESLDKQKNYILSGDEPYLVKLGISSADGRIHDKRQAKFRQINRFLEHIEDVYRRLPAEGEIRIYDLCCGKSYLSFAVYHYLTEMKGRRVYMYCADLKRDVINWCAGVANELGYSGMHFETADIRRIPEDGRVDMVISLHACDVATDIVIDTAARLGAEIILSTPCCHRYMNGKITAEELKFVTAYPQLANKMCEAMTDALRLLRLETHGYSVSALELTDPENTPKNTLLRALKKGKRDEAAEQAAKARYDAILKFLMGDEAHRYLKDI